MPLLRRAGWVGLLAVTGLWGCARGPPSRSTFELEAGPGQAVPELRRVLAAGTRAIGIVVEADPRTLLGLRSLRLGDRELVGSGGGRAETPEQSPRLGTFTFVYPYAPGLPAPEGPLALQIAADRPGPLRVTLLLPRDDGAQTLRVNLVTVLGEKREVGARTSAAHAAFERASALLGQAGLKLQLEARLTLDWREPLDEATDSWELPDGPLARLALAGAGQTRNDALNVFFVERLSGGVYGASLGAPGPLLPRTRYSGVVVREGEPFEAGRVLAHELAHYLGLRHLRTVTPGGEVLVDPIDDTVPGGANLMEHGDALTAGQAWVLRHSPLLR